MSVGGTRSNEWIFIAINDHETSEYRLIAARRPAPSRRSSRRARPACEYDLEEGGDVFFILTNADGAKDFKIVTAPVADPRRANWTELVPHEPGRLILSVLSLQGFPGPARAQGRPAAHRRARARDGEEHVIAFDEEAFSLGAVRLYEYDTEMMRFSYSSMTTPAQMFDYNMRTRERVLLKTQEVPSGHDPDHYVTRRLMAPSARRRAGAGVADPPSRHAARRLGALPALRLRLLWHHRARRLQHQCLSLVDRGFVYAIAHVRGGKDKGFSWYEDGKRAKKSNTFRDFIAAAEHLVAERYTSHDRIVAQGGSAGGMLMGAVVNMAPDHFGGIIAEVPFVDVLTTMLDETLPLTPPEWPEWGNPIVSEADYRTIAAYSPYDNVGAHDYPPILAVAGLTDPRVTYWEPAKWVARLRDRKTDDNPVLFKINMEAGHAGASGRFSRLDEIAYSYAFALKVVGLPKPQTSSGKAAE